MRRHVVGFAAVLVLAAWSLVVVAPAGAASAPGAPGKPTAVPGNRSARVSWPAPATHGSPITIYLVTPFLGTHAQATLSFHSKATTEVVTGLKNGRTYTFKVAAHNARGTSSRSAASAAVTIGTPKAPSILSAVPGNAQATVSWTTPANNGAVISSYIVTPYVGSAAKPAQTFNSNATSEIVTGLTNLNAYSFRVAAHNANGTGPQSPRFGPITPTAAPTISTAVRAGKTILVDASGQTVYLFQGDGASTTTKVSPGVLSLWPEVASSGTPTVGAGLDQTKLAVYIQKDGTPQVSYNGHLLYTFLYDVNPGDATGEGDSGFYFVDQMGNQA